MCRYTMWNSDGREWGRHDAASIACNMQRNLILKPRFVGGFRWGVLVGQVYFRRNRQRFFDLRGNSTQCFPFSTSRETAPKAAPSNAQRNNNRHRRRLLPSQSTYINLSITIFDSRCKSRTAWSSLSSSLPSSMHLLRQTSLPHVIVTTVVLILRGLMRVRVATGTGLLLASATSTSKKTLKRCCCRRITTLPPVLPTADAEAILLAHCLHAKETAAVKRDPAWCPNALPTASATVQAVICPCAETTASARVQAVMYPCAEGTAIARVKAVICPSAETTANAAEGASQVS